MSSSKNLEISGDLVEHPFAEVLLELLDSGLEGSIRVSARDSKAIFYFREGELLFAVSNQRRHRIFQILLDADLIAKEQLVEITDFTNDHLLAKALRESNTLPDSTLDTVFARQVESVFHESIHWREGTWAFSPLARIRDNLSYKPDIHGILIKYGREMSKENIVRRFKSFKEMFGRRATAPSHINLLPPEAFMLSRFEGGLLRVEELMSMTGMTDAENLRVIYSLWLGGFLERSGWNTAIGPRRILEIRSAKIEIKKQPPPIPEPATAEIGKQSVGIKEPESAAAPAEPPKREITLEAYLSRVEGAETHYETLGVPIDSDAPRLKQAYFTLAKQFHPDMYHRSADAVSQRRIQDAFTRIAHAFETLRNEETRSRYDYRLKSILDELRRQGKIGAEPEKQSSQTQLREASEIFDHGFNLLMDEDYDAALPYLTRAVSMAPEVARYHAYYGKVLATDRSQKFKAEAELQTAIKLDPGNPTFRILLAEFFVDYNLLKRAEGELNRILETFPDNPEAVAMLDRLR